VGITYLIGPTKKLQRTLKIHLELSAGRSTDKMSPRRRSRCARKPLAWRPEMRRHCRQARH